MASSDLPEGLDWTCRLTVQPVCFYLTGASPPSPAVHMAIEWSDKWRCGWIVQQYKVSLLELIQSHLCSSKLHIQCFDKRKSLQGLKMSLSHLLFTHLWVCKSHPACLHLPLRSSPAALTAEVELGWQQGSCADGMMVWWYDGMMVCNEVNYCLEATHAYPLTSQQFTNIIQEMKKAQSQGAKLRPLGTSTFSL